MSPAARRHPRHRDRAVRRGAARGLAPGGARGRGDQGRASRRGCVPQGDAGGPRDRALLRPAQSRQAIRRARPQDRRGPCRSGEARRDRGRRRAQRAGREGRGVRPRLGRSPREAPGARRRGGDVVRSQWPTRGGAGVRPRRAGSLGSAHIACVARGRRSRACGRDPDGRSHSGAPARDRRRRGPRPCTRRRRGAARGGLTARRRSRGADPGSRLARRRSGRPGGRGNAG